MWRGDPIVESKQLRLSLTLFGKITVPLGTYTLCSGIPTWLRCLSGIHIHLLAQREKLVVSRRKWQGAHLGILPPPLVVLATRTCPSLPNVVFSLSFSPKSHSSTSLSWTITRSLLSASRHVYVSRPEQEQACAFNDPSSQHRQVDPSSKIRVLVKEPSATATRATISQDSSSRKVSHNEPTRGVHI
jgi:hypothetical protein